MGILWTISSVCVAGIIAKFLHPGRMSRRFHLDDDTWDRLGRSSRPSGKSAWLVPPGEGVRHDRRRGGAVNCSGDFGAWSRAANQQSDVRLGQSRRAALRPPSRTSAPAAKERASAAPMMTRTLVGIDQHQRRRPAMKRGRRTGAPRAGLRSRPPPNAARVRQGLRLRARYASRRSLTCFFSKSRARYSG